MMKFLSAIFLLTLVLPSLAFGDGEKFEPPTFNNQTGQLNEPIVQGEVAQTVFLTSEPEFGSLEMLGSFGSMGIAVFAIVAVTFMGLYLVFVRIQRHRRRRDSLPTLH
jgi:hypothetical protein